MTADTDTSSGLDRLRAAIGGFAPIGETLGFHLVDVAEGSAALAAVPERRHYNPIGTVHGGFAATLLDSACGCAVQSRLKASQGFTTLELKVSYLKAMTADTGEVRAEGRVVEMGRRLRRGYPQGRRRRALRHRHLDAPDHRALSRLTP